MTSEFIVKEFSQESWPDFETLFGKHKGVRGGCWCTFNLCTSTQFNQMGRDGRKAFHKDLADQGLGSGLIVYDEDIPIAWCQFGLAERFPRFDRMRAYNALDPTLKVAPRWRIACLFVDKHRRREGLSTLALQAALETIGKQGGGIIEAFPFDVPGIERPHYNGSIKMFAREGFEIITRLGKNTVLMRRNMPATNA